MYVTAYCVPLMAPARSIGNTSRAREACDPNIGALQKRTFFGASHSIPREEREMRTILLIILVLLILGALPTWPYSAGWGYYPSGGLGLLLIILIILAVMGRI
jgi:hypothetical protein